VIGLVEMLLAWASKNWVSCLWSQECNRKTSLSNAGKIDFNKFKPTHMPSFCWKNLQPGIYCKI